MLPDQDNDGAPELVYLGEGPTGQYSLQVKAALTGSAWVSKTLGEGFPDADEDGLPDMWEAQYGLNPADPADAASDLDGDGLSARQEYYAGTHPNPNQVDTDSDGINDGQDAFPADASETLDTDGAGGATRPTPSRPTRSRASTPTPTASATMPIATTTMTAFRTSWTTIRAAASATRGPATGRSATSKPWRLVALPPAAAKTSSVRPQR